jgi:hypothetical protein
VHAKNFKDNVVASVNEYSSLLEMITAQNGDNFEQKLFATKHFTFLHLTPQSSIILTD